MVLGIIIYLQIDRTVSADELLMVIHIKDRKPKANRALSLSRLDRARRSQALPIFIGLGWATSKKLAMLLHDLATNPPLIALLTRHKVIIQLGSGGSY